MVSDLNKNFGGSTDLHIPIHPPCKTRNKLDVTKGALIWDQSGIRIIGIMRVGVCLEAILVPE